MPSKLYKPRASTQIHKLRKFECIDCCTLVRAFCCTQWCVGAVLKTTSDLNQDQRVVLDLRVSIYDWNYSTSLCAGKLNTLWSIKQDQNRSCSTASCVSCMVWQFAFPRVFQLVHGYHLYTPVTCHELHQPPSPTCHGELHQPATHPAPPSPHR